jgi:hypothetical protein
MCKRKRRYAPFQYVRFLDYAAERIFLRKVGGGYIFVHRMLLEYFASIGEAKKISERAAAEGQVRGKALPVKPEPPPHI